MKVWQYDNTRPLPRLIPGELPQPQPRPGEILVRVHAAGVTPSEVQWYPTTHTVSGEPRIGAVPGHEFSGVVAALGTNVGGLEVGQAVYGLNDWFAQGATAEYCVTKPEWVSPKPKQLSHAEAASVPIGALTAWQGLLDRAKLQPGERVLIHGGAGAVGVYAVQLARDHGAQVIATASERNREFLRYLGADEVIERHERFEDRVAPVDVVFDAVGGETLARSWRLLKPGGRLVTIAADSEGTRDERTKQAFFIVEPNQEQLREIAMQLDTKELEVVVDAVVPFSQAAEAYAGQISDRLGRGKVVIEIMP